MKDGNKRLHIAFLTTFDLQSIRTWSWAGTFYHMARALHKYCGDVTFINPGPCKEETIARFIHRSARLLLGKHFAFHNCFLVAKKHAKMTKQKLTEHTFDLIVAPAGETEIAFLDIEIPILLVEDATYALLIDYHQEYSNLLKRSIHELHVIEEKALKKASVVVSSSKWAAQSIVKDYNISPNKVHTVPFGANIERTPPEEIVERRKKSDCCRLLFIGANWQRKGGEIAIETLLKLEELGIRAELVICGSIPPTTVAHERMTVIPYLDKNDERQSLELEKLYQMSDFLFFPTRNDCYGIVVCEANAYGLPVIATDTGGVPDIVKEGENGFLLPYSAGGKEYAELIAKIYRDDQHYAELVRSSRAAFDERLNWDAWGVSIKKIIDELFEADNVA